MVTFTNKFFCSVHSVEDFFKGIIYILSFSGPLVRLSKILLQDLFFFYRGGTFHNLFFYLCNIYVRVISVHT